MNHDVAARLAGTLRDILGQPDLDVTDDLTAADVDAWDSVVHLELIFTIEDDFGISFDSEELLRQESFGALRRDVERHLEGRTP